MAEKILVTGADGFIGSHLTGDMMLRHLCIIIRLIHGDGWIRFQKIF